MELSDLHESEEAKLAQILGKQSSLNLSDTVGTNNSVTDILREVFDDLGVESAKDLKENDWEILDEALDRSSSRSPRRKSHPPKSPVVVPKTSVGKPIMNRTFDKERDRQRKVSPNIQREKDMHMKRELMKEKFVEKREEEAKELLRQLLSDEVKQTGKYKLLNKSK